MEKASFYSLPGKDPLPVPDTPPSEEFPGMVTTEILFSAVLILLLTANVAVVYQTKAYRVFNQMAVIASLMAL